MHNDPRESALIHVQSLVLAALSNAEPVAATVSRIAYNTKAPQGSMRFPEHVQ